MAELVLFYCIKIENSSSSEDGSSCSRGSIPDSAGSRVDTNRSWEPASKGRDNH